MNLKLDENWDDELLDSIMHSNRDVLQMFGSLKISQTSWGFVLSKYLCSMEVLN